MSDAPPLPRLLRRTARLVPPIGRLLRERADLRAQVSTLRKENRALRQEQRKARRILDPAVNRVDDRDLGYLFIVTYGRSGSTLLQGLLSSIPGYLIRGENAGVVYHLFQFHNTVMQRRRKHAGSAAEGGERSAWFGIDGYPSKRAYRQFRQLVLGTLLRPEADTRVTGFKEIRWDYPDLPDYLDFLRQVFPGARFVFNTRNLAAVAQSKWWAKNPEAVQKLEDIERKLLEAAEALGDDAFHVHYDDYTADVETLRPLFTWLGVSFRPDRLRRVLDRPHSY